MSNPLFNALGGEMPQGSVTTWADTAQMTAE